MNESRSRLVLEERKRLEVNGVRNVDSFDEDCIQLDSVQGGLEISGSGLKIAALDLDAGRVEISGQIESLIYGKSREERSARHRSKNVLTRLLK